MPFVNNVKSLNALFPNVNVFIQLKYLVTQAKKLWYLCATGIMSTKSKNK